MTRPARRVCALLISVLLLASACSPGNDGTTPSPTAGGPSPDAFSNTDVETVIERLAGAGIATFETPGDSPIVEPVSLLQLTREQARGLALEAWSGSGVDAAELDALDADRPEGAPTVSQWIAAYVSGATTPGADYARELMGDQELAGPVELSIPLLVATLFASDVATQVGDPTAATTALRMDGTAGAGAGAPRSRSPPSNSWTRAARSPASSRTRSPRS